MAAAGRPEDGARLRAGAVLALVLAAGGITAAIDRFGTLLPLQDFFAAVPLLAGLVVALAARSLRFGPVIAGAAPDEADAAAPAALLGAVALVAAPLGIGLGGLDGLALLGAFLAGGALALGAVAPALRSSGAPTVAGAVRHRFGVAAGTLAALASVLALVPILAAEAAMAGAVAHEMIGLEGEGVRTLVVAAAAIAALAGGRRSAMLMAAALLPVVALAFLAPLATVEAASGTLPLPWTALFDARSFATSTRMPAAVAIVLTLLLVLGLAALPSLAAPRRPGRSRRRSIGAFLAVAAVLSAAPAYVLHGRLAGIDPAVNPAGLVLNFAAYAGIGAAPALLLAGGLIAAAAMAMAMGLATLGATVAEDVYAVHLEPGGPEGRRVFIARLAIVAAALLALPISGGAAGIAVLAAFGLSIAAAGLAPVLLVGWNLRGAGASAATAAIAAGLAFVIADAGIAALAPGLGALVGMGSVRPTLLGPTGWLGLPVATSGAAGAVIGLAVLVAVTLLDRRHRRTGALPSPTPPQPEGQAIALLPDNPTTGAFRS